MSASCGTSAMWARGPPPASSLVCSSIKQRGGSSLDVRTSCGRVGAEEPESCSSPFSGAMRKMSNMTSAQTNCSEGGLGPRSEAPHIFLTLISQSGPPDLLRTQFSRDFVLYIIRSVPGDGLLQPERLCLMDADRGVAIEQRPVQHVCAQYLKQSSAGRHTSLRTWPLACI